METSFLKVGLVGPVRGGRVCEIEIVIDNADAPFGGSVGLDPRGRPTGARIQFCSVSGISRSHDLPDRRSQTAITTMTEAELNTLDDFLYQGIQGLHNQSETGGHARVLFYAMVAFLDERGLIDDFKAAANYMAVHGG